MESGGDIDIHAHSSAACSRDQRVVHFFQQLFEVERSRGISSGGGYRAGCAHDAIGKVENALRARQNVADAAFLLFIDGAELTVVEELRKAKDAAERNAHFARQLAQESHFG